MLLGRLDHSIETLQAIGAGVDGGRGPRKGLEVYCSRARYRCHIVEAPDTQDFLARCGQVAHDDIDIIVVGKEWDPVACEISKVQTHVAWGLKCDVLLLVPA